MVVGRWSLIVIVQDSCSTTLFSEPYHHAWFYNYDKPVPRDINFTYRFYSPPPLGGSWSAKVSRLQSINSVAPSHHKNELIEILSVQSQSIVKSSIQQPIAVFHPPLTVQPGTEYGRCAISTSRVPRV